MSRVATAFGRTRPVALLNVLAKASHRYRFLRFLCGGLLNTLFGYTVFVLALRLGALAGWALVASTTAGILFNFQTSRRIVFQSHQSGLLLRFTIVYAVVFALNYAAILLLGDLGLAASMAQTIMVLPMALLAFALQRNLVFTEA